MKGKITTAVFRPGQAPKRPLRKPRKNAAFLAVLVLSNLLSPASGQDRGGPVDFDVSASVDWTRGEFYGEVSYLLARAGLRMPTGRFMAGEILKDAYPRLLRPGLLSLRVNSGGTVGELAARGEISAEELDTLARESEKIPPALSADLARMGGKYTIYLDKLGALLGRRVRTVEARKPLIPLETADYTGIVIIADSELPVHGRRTKALAEPCVFPKIWDDTMSLVYERANFAAGGPAGNLMVRYTIPENIFHPAPSGLAPELAAFLGPYPLRVIAKEVFGIHPTDLVIDRDDALKILSSEHNRRLLREGRVALVLNAETLGGSFRIGESTTPQHE